MASATSPAWYAAESLTQCADSRVILHLDLDCFYAQVEMRRLGVARDQPLAVQQWDGVIAVNYAARKFVSSSTVVGVVVLHAPFCVVCHKHTRAALAHRALAA